MVFVGDPFTTNPDGSNGWSGRGQRSSFTDAAGRIGTGGFGFMGLENGSFGAFGLLFKGALGEAAGLGFDSGGEEDMIAMAAWSEAMESCGNPGQEAIIGEMRDTFISAAEAALHNAASETPLVDDEDLGLSGNDESGNGGTWFAYEADPYEILVSGCSHPEAVEIILDEAVSTMVSLAADLAEAQAIEEAVEGALSAAGGGLGEAVGALIGFFF